MAFGRSHSIIISNINYMFIEIKSSPLGYVAYHLKTIQKPIYSEYHNVIGHYNSKVKALIACGTNRTEVINNAIARTYQLSK
jgi:hypothetical protein